MDLHNDLKKVVIDVKHGEITFEYETTKSSLYAEFQQLIERAYKTQSTPFSEKVFADLVLSLIMRESFITAVSDLMVRPQFEGAWFSPNPVNKACFSVSFKAGGRDVISIRAEREDKNV